MYSDDSLAPSSPHNSDSSGKPNPPWSRPESRRQFLGRAGKMMALGGFASLLGRNGELVAALAEGDRSTSLRPAPKATRVIQLFMAGGPSQLETWDYKPGLASYSNRELPESMRGRTGGQRLGIAPGAFRFRQHGQAGHWVSDLFPYTARIVDELAVIKSMHADGHLHESATRQMLTGCCDSGGTSIGSQIAAALDSTDTRRPSFAVLQAQSSRSGKLPLLSASLETSNSLGMDSNLRDLSDEPQSTWNLYGDSAKEPGTFAHQCLLARRFAEKGGRFTQVFHPGWDTHSHLPNRMEKLGEEIDRPIFALLTDLRQRGLLDETLVVWGGEFGRTFHSQNTMHPTLYGRDHHSECFSMWMAGGGVQAGLSYGETDEFSHSIVKDPVHVRDLHATILHLLGLNSEPFQGIESGRVIRNLFA